MAVEAMEMASDACPAVRLDGLIKHYGDEVVVRNLDLQVDRGEFLGILGPNGAGKTTTLRMLLGLAPRDGGSISVLGLRVPEDNAAIRQRLGVVPQFDTLDVDFTVEENLRVYARYFGLTGAAVETRIAALLEEVQLSDRRRSRVPELSGGMKRRLTLARALVNDPELIVLDEPTTGLDPQARHHLWRVLRALHRRGRTIVLTTHYMEEAEELCDRVAILDHGEMLVCDTPRTLIETHVEPQVISVFGGEARAFVDQELVSQLPAAVLLRVQTVADSALVYTDAAAAVVKILNARGLRHAQRPASLEDVFLRLTGHDLRD